MRTFPTILPNSPVSPNLPYSPLLPKALIKFRQICHFRHCMASFAKFTTFAAFAKSLGKILSNSPFSRLRAFLDISDLCLIPTCDHDTKLYFASCKICTVVRANFFNLPPASNKTPKGKDERISVRRVGNLQIDSTHSQTGEDYPVPLNQTSLLTNIKGTKIINSHTCKGGLIRSNTRAW